MSTDQLEFPWAGPPQGAAPVEPAPPERVSRPDAPAATPSAAGEDRATHRQAMQAAAEALLEDLTRRTSLIIRLHVTNNSSTMMTVQRYPEKKFAKVRLHHMFLEAPPEVRQALSEWIRKPKVPQAGEVIDAFIRAHREKIRPGRRRTVYLRTKGRYFDLQRLFDEVNAAHFDGKITAHITWGKLSSWPRRSIRYGSYMHQDNVIRIHPLLDQEFVPEFVVRYIVFHEMLHALLGVEEGPNGRRRVHPPEFKRLEAAYPDFARASAWCDDKHNFRRVLRMNR